MSKASHYICLHGPLDGALVPADEIPPGYTLFVLRTARQSELGREEVALIHSHTLMIGNRSMHYMLYSKYLSFREQHDANTSYRA